MDVRAGAATELLVDGRYRLGEVLGTGGAAVVRRALDERLRRDVAVKLFHPGTADEQRQSGELALMASLSHPALVRMYDGGRIDDVNGARSAYLVMEYVPGPTLHRALDAGPMTWSDAAAIGAALAAALAYLHEQGVVHRDVKPANVLLPPDDEIAAKLGDFGVARLLDGTRVTATGMTVGTANYLSPEQVRGESVGPPSDVYSLGLLLLEALTGQIAYDGVGVTAALARLNRPPVIPMTLGPAWRSLLAAMLDADPAARPDAAQVRRGLGVVETSAPPPADPDAATATMPVNRARGTAMLPAPGRHRVSGEWPEAYLVDDEPRPRRRVQPMAAFLLMGTAAVAIIVGVLAASMSRDGTHSPAAPVNPSASTPPSNAAPTHAAPTSAVAAHPTTAPGTKAAPESKAAPGTKAAPESKAAPASKATQVAGPGTPAGGAATTNTSTTTRGNGHGKAKGHSKHGGT